MAEYLPGMCETWVQFLPLPLKKTCVSTGLEFPSGITYFKRKTEKEYVAKYQD